MRTTSEQRLYRQEVEALLDQIRGRVRELRRLSARGLGGAELGARKRELAALRERLAAVVRGEARVAAGRPAPTG